MALFQQKGFHYFTMHQDMKLIFQMCINVLNVLLVHLTCQHSNIVWVIIIWSLTVVTLSSTLVLKLKNEHRMTIIIMSAHSALIWVYLLPFTIFIHCVSGRHIKRAVILFIPCYWPHYDVQPTETLFSGTSDMQPCIKVLHIKYLYVL